MLVCINSITRKGGLQPVPWHFSQKPFPAYRCSDGGYQGVLHVSNDYRPQFDRKEMPTNNSTTCPLAATDFSGCKVITTRKGLLLVPCEGVDQQNIMLLTLQGYYDRVEPYGGVIVKQYESRRTPVLIRHLVVKFPMTLSYACVAAIKDMQATVFYLSFKPATMRVEQFEAWKEERERGYVRPMGGR